MLTVFSEVSLQTRECKFKEQMLIMILLTAESSMRQVRKNHKALKEALEVVMRERGMSFASGCQIISKSNYERAWHISSMRLSNEFLKQL